jgi:hypothetical protein
MTRQQAQTLARLLGETASETAIDPSDTGDAVNGQKTPGGAKSSLTIEEANNIEEQLLTDAGYNRRSGRVSSRRYQPDGVLQRHGRDKYAERRGRVLRAGCTYSGNAPSYTDNRMHCDDRVTGLMWQQDPGIK